jgi:hypothetical protein
MAADRLYHVTGDCVFKIRDTTLPIFLSSASGEKPSGSCVDQSEHSIDHPDVVSGLPQCLQAHS